MHNSTFIQITKRSGDLVLSILHHPLPSHHPGGGVMLGECEAMHAIRHNPDK